MKFEFPDQAPGIHPLTAALTRILRLKGIHNPLTNEPYSEAFLLGMGGGLGAGYILFSLKHLPHPMLLLGFRNQWNNPKAFLGRLTSRLQFNAQFNEFKEKLEAQEALQTSLKMGSPAIVWVDKASLPYHILPENMQGYISHQVAVHARDGRLWRLYLDDCSSRPIEIREKTFTKARAGLIQDNFLMMTFIGAQENSQRQLRKAIIKSIESCSLQLTHPARTIGISSLETWADDLTTPLSQHGWPNIFSDPKILFPVLRTIYETIKLDGTEGFALRRMYSDFLHEAAEYLNNPTLNATAGQYLQLSSHWANLAEIALPSSVPAFDQVKNLLNKIYNAYRESNMKAVKTSHNQLNKQISKLQSEFPLDKFNRKKLFQRLSTQVKLIAELEMNAAVHLRNAIKR